VGRFPQVAETRVGISGVPAILSGMLLVKVHLHDVERLKRILSRGFLTIFYTSFFEPLLLLSLHTNACIFFGMNSQYGVPNIQLAITVHA